MQECWANFRRILCGVAVACVLFSAGLEAADAQGIEPLAKVRHGVTLLAYPPASDRISGIPTTSAARAMSRMLGALELLIAESPLFKKRLRNLVSAGRPHLIYDAQLSREKGAAITVAFYLPEHFQPDQDKTDFIVGIGRAGILWEIEELAPFIAHELAGHAHQHLSGRLDLERELDIECEAYLVQEQATQDLELDKLSREQVLLRQALESHWCSDFRRFTLRQNLDVAAQWERRDPDIGALLDAYRAYMARPSAAHGVD